MNEENSNHDMPDPIDFVPGSKITNSSEIINTPSAPKIKLMPYALPMVINLIIFGLIQLWVSSYTSSLPADQQGESGAAWLNLLIVPAEVIIFVICLITLLIGLSRLFRTK